MKVAINGFGRIGEAVFKLCFQNGIEVVAINDVHGVDSAAYTLKYDSIYGKLEGEIKVKKDSLEIDGKSVRILSERDPLKLPWEELEVDIVIEATGAFTERQGAMKHIVSGAKKVIVTAPSDDADITVVPGVNESKLDKKQQVISVASCTTNALAPVLKILNEKYRIRAGLITTIHAYTASQGLVDDYNKSKRKGRAAIQNIIPTTTGASKAVCQVLPELTGKISAFAVRVPIPVGSLIDLSVELEKKFTIKEINKVMKKASKGKYKGIVGYTEDEIVSSDIIGCPESSIVDSLSTQKEGNLLKLVSWYDNEFGYSNRVVDVLKLLKKWVR